MGFFQNLMNSITGKDKKQYLPTKVDKESVINIDEGIKRYLIELSQNLRETGKINSYNALVSINAHNYEEYSEKIEKDKQRARRKIYLTGNKKQNVCEYTHAEQSLYYTYLKLKEKNPDLSCTPMEIPPIYLQISDNEEEIDSSYNRYYLNLKPTNVAKFAEEFLKLRYDKKKTAFKVRTTEGLKKSKHMDTIIIYENPDDEMRLYDDINYIYSKHPELFEGAERNNPFCKKGKLPFVSVGKELKGTSYNGIISQCLESAIYELVENQYGKTNIEDFLYGISEKNVEQVKEKLKPLILEQFEKRKDTVSEEVKESLGVPIKRVKEKKLQWYERSITTKRCLEINNGKENKMNILQTHSAVEGLEKYIIQYRNKEGNIINTRSIYSEGLNFDLMLQDEEYTHMVVDILLKEDRMREKEELAKRFGLPNKISYVGTIYANSKGQLVKKMEQNSIGLRNIFNAIKKSELSNINERKRETWEKQ